MSQANRYQSEIFLNSIWNSMLQDISKDRKISIQELNTIANNLQIQYPEDALGKFVDALAYEDEVVTELKKAIKLKDSDKLNFKSLAKYEGPAKELKLKAPKIAVIYAVGDINGGEGNDEE